MSVNSSFNSSNSSIHLPIICFGSRPGIFIFVAFSVTNVFLLPLYILVLYMGYQRRRQQRSGSAAGMTSHSDIFTYNMIGLELIGVLGCCFYCCGALTNVKAIVLVGMDIFSITSPGQTLFHLLTCVERYLAVVHPIIYLGLRQAGQQLHTVDMADNSSSVSSSSDFNFLLCETVSASSTMAIIVTAVRTILMLPLCTAVLYLSLRQRKQQLSFTTTSHADIFTYHMIAMQMLWFLSAFCFILTPSLLGVSERNQNLLLLDQFEVNCFTQGHPNML
ncbi:hypothetical protein D9C73_026635 [Collichthys lucidus]|uniref:G-protein coupled receptors family 1 profile domain-containing protein n=1 Tax=Collichthys lucidus TaxID=240159 RepID=A0A4U5VWY0_COLLU|nr:hypothetical protein D9C73_026635 [Collichthys lucidus]